MARPKKTEQVLDIVPEEVELKVVVPKQVVVYDSVDKVIKLVTEQEARNPRFKPI